MEPKPRAAIDVKRTSYPTLPSFSSATNSSSNYFGRTASYDPYNGDRRLKDLELYLKDKIDELNPHGYMTASKILWHYSLNIPELNKHNFKFNEFLYRNLSQYIKTSIQVENRLLANDLQERNMRIKEDRFLSTLVGGLLGIGLHFCGSTPVSNITTGSSLITVLALNEFSLKLDRLALTAGLTAMFVSWHFFNPG